MGGTASARSRPRDSRAAGRGDGGPSFSRRSLTVQCAWSRISFECARRGAVFHLHLHSCVNFQFSLKFKYSHCMTGSAYLVSSLSMFSLLAPHLCPCFCFHLLRFMIL